MSIKSLVNRLQANNVVVQGQILPNITTTTYKRPAKVKVDNPPTDGWVSTPSSPRKGVGFTLIPNSYTKSKHEPAWLASYKFSYTPTSPIITNGYWVKDAIYPSGYTGAGNPVPKEYWYTANDKTQGGHYQITPNVAGRAHIGPGVLLSDRKDSTDSNTLVSGTKQFYVQSSQIDAFTHDTNKRRTSTSTHSFKFNHRFRDALSSNYEYTPYETRYTDGVVRDIIRAEIATGTNTNGTINLISADTKFNSGDKQNNDRTEWIATSFYLNENGRAKACDAVGGAPPTTYTVPAAAKNSEWITGPERTIHTKRHSSHIFQMHGNDGWNPNIGLVIWEGVMQLDIKWADNNPTDATGGNTVDRGTVNNEGEVRFNWGAPGALTEYDTIGHVGTVNADGRSEIGTEGPPPVGQWVDLIMKVKWDWRPCYSNLTTKKAFGDGYDGRVEIWVAYVPYGSTKRILRKWIDHKGPNCYKQDKTPYFKQGCYLRHAWSGVNTGGLAAAAWGNERTAWVDQIRILRNQYNGAALVHEVTFNDVVPDPLV